jgi:hypothetical protein
MRNRHVSPVRVGLVALACLSFVASCGSDDDSDSSSEPAEAAESNDQPAAASAVAAGYADMLAAMTALSADPVSATDAALDAVRDTWRSFDDTVKQQDPNAHSASEDALDDFLEAGKDGNSVAMADATAKMSDAATAYLAAHPA